MVFAALSGCTVESGSGVSGTAESGGGVSVVSPIRIDQFGYRPGDPKVAVIADPVVGFDADAEFEAGGRYEVRRWSDDVVVFTGAPRPWADGRIDEQSGDRGWWFDFSAVQDPGSYYLLDVERGVSTGRFEISETVYDDVLKAALRMFWYNRANTPHPAALAGPWADEAAYVGPGQDTEVRAIDDPSDPSTARDLSGGWFDAGDPNKYVSFAREPVHQLLTAYASSPDVFDDAVGIPESGNGVPDILDEVFWEIQWLERMQRDDGGVLTKVGILDWSSPDRPSRSTLPRFYEEVCSSATISAAGMFAHAAIVFESVPSLRADAARLRARAEDAWDWYRANEKRDDCDPVEIKAGDADMTIEEQQGAEVVAAVYLFSMTSDPAYAAVVEEKLETTVPFTDDGFGRYAPDQADALLFYRRLVGADPATVAVIDSRIAELVDGSPTYGFDPQAGLYRSFMPDPQYHWGSNRVMANIGTANLAVEGVPGGRERALEQLHYFHGANPLATVYLSNMGEFGAERSVQTLFHFWFGERSDIGVPPGFVVGGPNASYSGDAVPPAGQPPAKSYRDWAPGGSEPSWEVTEPAIYYQAAYVRLLSAVIASDG